MKTLKDKVMETLLKEKEMKHNGLQVLSETPQFSIKQQEAFTAKLNQQPLKVDKVQGFDTIPISTVENELDEDFAGLWQIENFRWQVVANEIIGSLDLLVYHPIAHVWLKRSGSASVMIQQDSGAKIDDIGAKKKNALIKDFPKLEIMCIKSAAKKLGEKYGRSLNRKWMDSYEAVYSNELESNEAIEEIGSRMKECKTMEELLAIWNEYPDQHSNIQFKKNFTYYRNSINKK